MGRLALVTFAAGLGLALTQTPARANLLDTCTDGVSVNMVIVDGVVDSNAMVECVGGSGGGTTGGSTTGGTTGGSTTGGSTTGGSTTGGSTTGGSTTGPAACSDTQVCPNGCITSPILGGYGLSKLSIPNGTVRTYCAPVMSPYVSDTGTLEQIKFQFYDESDRDCGYVVMSVEQTTGAMMTLSSQTPLSNGNILYRSSWGPYVFPERTALGMYRVTLTGYGGCATTFRVGWGAS